MELVPSSYLRVYQTLDSFEEKESKKWEAYIEEGSSLPMQSSYASVTFDEPQRMGFLYPRASEHAFVRKSNGQWYVCPWGTRLRVLMGILSFRESLPYQIADNFVPEEAAEKAEEELQTLRQSKPKLQPHILSASWHVPLRWFLAFEDAEREVIRDGGSVKVRYQGELASSVVRIKRAIDILRKSGMAEVVVQPVEDLVEWLQQFPPTSLLELDYGSVGSLFSDEDLVLDRGAGEVWSCVEALEVGDFEESGRIYSELAGWWGRVRALENAN